MTIKEFYDAIGGGYEEMLNKFRADDRILRFLGMFKRDTSFEQLREALKDNDCQRAFAAAHTLKGVSMNLCLHDVITEAVKITEALRAQNMDEALRLWPAVESVCTKAYSLLENVA